MEKCKSTKIWVLERFYTTSKLNKVIIKDYMGLCHEINLIDLRKYDGQAASMSLISLVLHLLEIQKISLLQDSNQNIITSIFFAKPIELQNLLRSSIIAGWRILKYISVDGSKIITVSVRENLRKIINNKQFLTNSITQRKFIVKLFQVCGNSTTT